MVSSNGRILVAVMLLVFVLAGCGGKGIKGDSEMKYNARLAATEPGKIGTVEPGSELESKALDRFVSFYEVFSTSVISEGIRTLYAESAYFRDGFREVEGIEAIEAYFLKSAATVHECTFQIQDIAVHDGNYYLRWVMHLETKRWKNQPITATGMSHIRFDREGMVIFHQDYWDTSLVYEKIPLMGSVIRWVRKQF